MKRLEARQPSWCPQETACGLIGQHIRNECLRTKAQQEDWEWLLRMVELEEKNGQFPPGGFAGGAIAISKHRELTNASNSWENEGGAFTEEK